MHQLGVAAESTGDLYGPHFAGFYDRFLGTYVEDLPAFERYLRPGMRVLDLACGAGRLSFPLARLGASVDGLELSADMLALAALHGAQDQADVADRVRFVQGDMSRFALDREYDLVILGITSISLLRTPELRAGLFACVARHLAPGGRFVFDTIDPDGSNAGLYTTMTDMWSREDDEGIDFALIGQQLSADGGTLQFNVYREQLDWAGATRRSLGCSSKAWLPRAMLHAEIAASALAVETEFTLADLRFYVLAHRGATP
nr:daptide-type RiPP biosynthesis methyltransferase [Duganella sp. FT27W]